MGIKSGIGIGEAQVYDTSSIVNGYYKLIQEEQKKQAKYADELADVLSKVDFKNLDPIDYKYINQEYQNAKGIANKYSGSRNTLEQRLAISEAKKAMQGIEEYAMGARVWRKNISDVANDMLANPEDYDDESKDEVKKLISGSYADAIKLNRASITPFTYKRIQDVSLVDKTIDGARKALQTMMEESGKFTKIVKDGFEQLAYSIPQESVTGLLTAEMTANPKIKFQFKELYKQMNPEAEKPTDIQLADFARSLYEKKYQQQSYKFIGQKFKADKPKEKSETEKNQQVWEQMNIDAFGKNSTQAIANLNKIAGSKATLSGNADGSITVVYKPVIDMASGPIYYAMESPMAKKVKTRNGAELMAALRDAGVTGSIAQSFMRLGGASKTKSQKGELD